MKKLYFDKKGVSYVKGKNGDNKTEKGGQASKAS